MFEKNLDHVISRKEMFENRRRKKSGITIDRLVNETGNQRVTNKFSNKSTVFELTERFVKEYLGNDYEAVFAVHDNTEHPHSHIVFNSVSFRDGKKYHSRTTMLANSEFVALLKQANTDSSKMAEVIGVSDAQLRFVTNSQSGMGLLKCGNVVIPFDNQIGKDTSLYKLYNTNIHEKIAEQKEKEKST